MTVSERGILLSWNSVPRAEETGLATASLLFVGHIMVTSASIGVAFSLDLMLGTDEVRDFGVGFAWSILTDVRNLCVCTVVEVIKRCPYNGKPSRRLRTKFPAPKILREVCFSFFLRAQSRTDLFYTPPLNRSATPPLKLCYARW